MNEFMVCDPPTLLQYAVNRAQFVYLNQTECLFVWPDNVTM
jgi:hypothetical protein